MQRPPCLLSFFACVVLWVRTLAARTSPGRCWDAISLSPRQSFKQFENLIPDRIFVLKRSVHMLVHFLNSPFRAVFRAAGVICRTQNSEWRTLNHRNKQNPLPIIEGYPPGANRKQANLSDIQADWSAFGGNLSARYTPVSLNIAPVSQFTVSSQKRPVMGFACFGDFVSRSAFCVSALGVRCLVFCDRRSANYPCGN